MVGCNATINLGRLGKHCGVFPLFTLYIKAIDLSSTNATLVPVPGKLYFYKANIQSNDDVMQSALTARERFGPLAFVIKVFILDGNVTSYSLLVCYLLKFYVIQSTIFVCIA